MARASFTSAAGWRPPVSSDHSRPRGLRMPRAVRARATPRRLLTPLDGADVGGERIGGLATDLDGRLPGCGEAGATELDAAALGGGQGGLGALADRCPFVLGDGGEGVGGEAVGVRGVGGGGLAASGPSPRA